MFYRQFRGAPIHRWADGGRGDCEKPGRRGPHKSHPTTGENYISDILSEKTPVNSMPEGNFSQNILANNSIQNLLMQQNLLQTLNQNIISSNLQNQQFTTSYQLSSLLNPTTQLLINSRRRKARTVFTDDQLNGLESRFQIQRYLSTPERTELAVFLGLKNAEKIKINDSVK